MPTSCHCHPHPTRRAETKRRGLLHAERGDWLKKIGEARDRLVAALKKPAILQIAKDEFHFVPNAEMLARLQYAQSKQFADNDRGAGFWNNISMGLMDIGSATGVQTEQKFGEYTGAATEAVKAEDGTQSETDKMAAAEAARQEYLASHGAYESAKAAAAATAGAIVAVIVSTLVTIASAGTAGPACAAFIGGLAGAVLQEGTEALIQGNDYDFEQGGEDLAVALVTGLITLGMGAVVDKLAKGAAATERVKAIQAALKAKYGETFAAAMGTVSTEALGAALKDFPASYAEDLMRTEGIFRQEFMGVEASAKKTLKGLGTSLVTQGISWSADQLTGIGAGLEALKKSGNWDEYDDLLIQKKLVDLTIATTVNQVAAGQMPDAKGWVAILCKVASTPHGAKVGTEAAKKDAAATLDFFNTASADELKKVAYIGDATAAEIIAQREKAPFGNIEQVLEVKYVRDNILTPAALEIRDEYIKLKEAEKATAGADPAAGGS